LATNEVSAKHVDCRRVEVPPYFREMGKMGCVVYMKRLGKLPQILERVKRDRDKVS
jgi:hypothetical protein